MTADILPFPVAFRPLPPQQLPSIARTATGSAPAIYITDAAVGSGYDVAVIPAASGRTFGRRFAAYLSAWAYAVTLRTAHSWPIVDRTSGGGEAA